MNIAFLGAKDIGLRCLEILQDFCSKTSDHTIVGVLTNGRGESIREFCRVQNIYEIKSLNEFLTFENVDLLISVQYHEILKKAHINNAKIAVNLHMAPLPEYRGCNQFTYAILHGRVEFGTTIHMIDEGVDTGDILFEDRFSISPDIWVSDLYDLTVLRSAELFMESVPKLISGCYQKTPQNQLIEKRGSMTGFRRDIEELKFIKNFSSRSEFDRQIRATSMPGFSPPYVLIRGERFEIKAVKDTLND